MAFLLKIVPWIQNGMSVQTRRNTKWKTGRRSVLKGVLTDGEGLASEPYSSLLNPRTWTPVSCSRWVELTRERNPLWHNVQPAMKWLSQDQCHLPQRMCNLLVPSIPTSGREGKMLLENLEQCQVHPHTDQEKFLKLQNVHRTGKSFSSILSKKHFLFYHKCLCKANTKINSSFNIGKNCSWGLKSDLQFFLYWMKIF